MSASSSTRSLPKPVFYVNQPVLEGWQVLEELGRGGCGVVVLVERRGGQRAALKAETIDPAGKLCQTVKVEAHVLRHLQNCRHFCRLLYACRLSAGVNVMIMSLVGRSMSWLRRQCPHQRLSVSTSVRIGIQCLDAIEELHQHGFIHRDVKASNFAIGATPEDCRNVYMLDFGFARSYLTEADGALKLRPARQKVPFVGTDRYCSVNVHMRREYGRVDDLWSFLFMLVELIRGKLPWKNVDEDRLAEAKAKHVETFLQDCPVELWPVLRHLQALRFDSRPDYGLVRAQLAEVCRRRRFRPHQPFDWERGGAHFARVAPRLRAAFTRPLPALPDHASTASEADLDS